MNLLLFRSFLFVALVFSACSLPAQIIYNTPYSVYGLGTLSEKSSSLNRGMALTGIGVQDPFNLNHINPASYTFIMPPFSKMFELGTYLESNRYLTDKAEKSGSNGGLSNLSYWFKLSPRWSSVLALSPFSGVDYTIKTTRNLGVLNDVDYVYEGSGNISRFTFGNAFKVTGNFSVGVNASFLFGSLNKFESVASSSLTPLVYESSVYTNKFDFDFGAQYRVRLNKRYLTVGIIADDGLTLRGTRKGKLYTAAGDTLDSSDGDDVHYKLPLSLGAGLALHADRSILAADVRFKQWSGADFEDQQDLAFNDTWRVSAGYTYRGDPAGETFLSFASLRAGLYFENYYLTLEEQRFLNWGLSAGFSIPLFDGKSTLGLNYAYDRMGTTSNNLILQHSQKIMFDIVIRDLWGTKRKFD